MLVMALNYRPMYVAVSNIFFYHEKTLALLYITFAAGLIALVANLIFIPFYGIWAAVIVNYVAFLYMGYSGFFFPLFKENSQVSYHPLAAFSIQIALTLLCVFFLDSGFVTKIIITSIYLHIKILKYDGYEDINIIKIFLWEMIEVKGKAEGFAAYQEKYRQHVGSSGNSKKLENTCPFLVDKGHYAMLDAFVKSIQNDTPSPCDELAGFRATYLAQKAIEALELKRALPVPIEKITPCIN